jgi:hypothetical protein
VADSFGRCNEQSGSTSSCKMEKSANPRAVHVRFVVDTVALEQDFLEYFRFPCQHHSTTVHSSSCSWYSYQKAKIKILLLKNQFFSFQCQLRPFGLPLRLRLPNYRHPILVLILVSPSNTPCDIAVDHNGQSALLGNSLFLLLVVSIQVEGKRHLY